MTYLACLQTGGMNYYDIICENKSALNTDLIMITKFGFISAVSKTYSENY